MTSRQFDRWKIISTYCNIADRVPHGSRFPTELKTTFIHTTMHHDYTRIASTSFFLIQYLVLLIVLSFLSFFK